MESHDFDKNIELDPERLGIKHREYLPALDIHSKLVNANDSGHTTESLIPAEDKPELHQATSTNFDENDWKHRMAIIGGLLGLIIAVMAIAYFLNRQVEPNSNADSAVTKIESVDDSLQQILSLIPDRYKSVIDTDVLLKGCVVITGTFLKEFNAVNMANSIKTKGYTPYIERYEKMYRVGLKFDCVSQDLDDFLLAIKSEIHPKAWYLSPEGYQPL